MTTALVYSTAYRILIAEFAEYQHALDSKLRDLARANGIGIAKDVSLYAIARQAVSRAGVKQDLDSTTLDVIGQVTARPPVGGTFEDYAPDYIRNVLIAGLVTSLKKKSWSLHRIKSHPKIIELAALIRLRPSTLDRYYKSDRSNKTLKDVEAIIEGRKGRAGIFEAYLKSAPNETFEAYWFSSCRNQARDLLRARAQQADILSRAVHIAPEVFDEDRRVELSREPEQDGIVAKDAATRLKRDLARINPDYLTVINLMVKEGLDITNNLHAKKFMSALLFRDRRELTKFTHKFLADLRSCFARLDITTLDDAQRVLKQASKKRVRSL